MLKRLSCDFSFHDERGSLTQLVHGGYGQVNVITSKKGALRGGHYHKLNEEAFYIVSGSLELTVNGATYSFRQGDFFDTVLVSRYSRGVVLEDGSKDIYTE